MIDEEKKEKMKILIHEVVNTLDQSEVISANVNWSDPHGIDPHLKCHADYLDIQSTLLYNKMRQMIDQQMSNRKPECVDALTVDVLQGWNHAKRLSSRMIGRDEILNDIFQYLVDETSQALVVHGETGMGVSSVMACAANMAHSWVTSNNEAINTTVILRFCGLLPAWNNLRELLAGICRQIAYATDRPFHDIPKDHQKLKKFFKELMESAEFRGMVILFIDAVDLISADDYAQKLNWIPEQLSANVKIIISTTNTSPTLGRLKQKITDANNYIKVGPFTTNESYTVLHQLLASQERMVTFHQWRLLREAFSCCSQPLYISTLLELTKTWRSSDPLSDCKIGSTTEENFNLFLDNLENNHNCVFLSHAAGYIAASRRGISENELEHLLSLDDEVLDTVHVSDIPRVRRMPAKLIQRLLYDLRGFLCYTEVDESTVISWSHTTFLELIKKRYVSKIEEHRELHRHLTEYYTSQWSMMKPKPVQCNKHNVKPSGLVRYVPTQPVAFQTCSNKPKYNNRKLFQLPYNMAQVEDKNILLHEDILFNYDWLLNNIKATGTSSAILDCGLVAGDEVQILADALKLSQETLEANPMHLSVELLGHLLPYYSSHKYIRYLLKQCDRASALHCPLSPVWHTYDCPGGPLRTSMPIADNLDHQNDFHIFQNKGDVSLIAKSPDENKAYVWDLQAAEEKTVLKLPIGSQLFPTPDGRFVYVFHNNSCVRKILLENGKEFACIHFDKGEIRRVAPSNRYISFTYKSLPGPVLIDTEANVVLDRLKYQSQVVEISKDERYFVCNSGLSLCFHKLPLMERICSTNIQHLPSKIVFTRDSLSYFIMFQNKEIHSVDVKLIQKRATTVNLLNDLEMQDFSLSHNETLMLVRSSRSLYLLDTSNKTIRHHIQDFLCAVFVESLTTIKDACFNYDDTKVVAIRQSFVGIWDTESGNPLRLLQLSVNLVTKLFTTSIENQVITLLDDSTMQFWNIAKLNSPIRYKNIIVQEGITDIAVAKRADRVFCCGPSRAEAIIFNMKTGKCESIVQHHSDITRQIEHVLISPDGRYGVTRMRNTGFIEELDEPWALLKEDKLWNLDTGHAIHTALDNRFVIFSPSGNKIIFFPCRHYDHNNMVNNAYDAVVMDVTNQNSYLLEISRGEIVGEPVIVGDGDYLAYILQQPQQPDRHDSGSTNTKRKEMLMFLCCHSFSKQWRGEKRIWINDLWSGVNDEDNFIDIREFTVDSLFLVYGKGVKYLTHSPDGTLDRSKVLPKGAFVYDVRKDCLLKRCDNALCIDTDMDKLILSSKRSIFMDNTLRVFDGTSATLTHKLNLTPHVVVESVHLLLDGKYLVALSRMCDKLAVYRVSDGHEQALIPLHGRGRQVGVCGDDRTIIVATDDGRLLTYVLTLESPDIVYELIGHLPSRNENAVQYINPLKNDIKLIHQTENEHRQKSALARKDFSNDSNRLPGYRTIHDTATLTKELCATRSQSCSVQ